MPSQVFLTDRDDLISSERLKYINNGDYKMAFSDYIFGANTGVSMSQRASGKTDALIKTGRKGDASLVHATPFTKDMLKAMGGAGTINPKSGLMEFYPAFKKIKY